MYADCSTQDLIQTGLFTLVDQVIEQQPTHETRVRLPVEFFQYFKFESLQPAS